MTLDCGSGKNFSFTLIAWGPFLASERESMPLRVELHQGKNYKGMDLCF